MRAVNPAVIEAVVPWANRLSQYMSSHDRLSPMYASRLQHGASRLHPLLTSAAQKRASDAAQQLRTLLGSSSSMPLLLSDPTRTRQLTPAKPAQVAAELNLPTPLPRASCLPPLPDSCKPVPPQSDAATPAAGAMLVPPPARSSAEVAAPASAATSAVAANPPAPTATSSREMIDAMEHAAVERNLSVKSVKGVSSSRHAPGRARSWRVVDTDELSDAEEALTYRICFWPLHVWKRFTVEAKEAGSKLTGTVGSGLSRIRAWRVCAWICIACTCVACAFA